MSLDKLSSYFGFTATPFRRNLAPAMLHRHGGHAEAVARIRWCIAETALGVSAGKTVALRAALAELDASRHTVIYLPNPAVGARGLYAALVTGLGGVPRFHTAALIAQTMDHLAAEKHERGRAVVVAVDPIALGTLSTLPAEPMRGLATWWFAAPVAPSTLPLLFVDAAGRGPVVNTAVVSNVAAGYAPAGAHLVQCSAVLDGALPTEAEVRAHAGFIYDSPTDDWRLLDVHELPHSLPVMAPGMQRPPIDLGGGVFVAGDHVEGASIQGALLSGRRTAEAVLAESVPAG